MMHVLLFDVTAVTVLHHTRHGAIGRYRPAVATSGHAVPCLHNVSVALRRVLQPHHRLKLCDGLCWAMRDPCSIFVSSARITPFPAIDH
jgi:hypothetical protein